MKLKISVCIISYILLKPLSIIGQNTSLVGFYNCENLFDTINDPIKQDEEYLPSSRKHWDTKKYHEKLNHLSRVILAMNDWIGPDILGLCEVENKKVVEDLINKTYLIQYDYKVIHEECKDKRGIDIAMIYKPSSFELLEYEYIPIIFRDNKMRPTRDILYTKGILKNKDTAHLFFNHWPSRFDGIAATKSKREFAATVLKNHVDSIFNLNSKAIILISGDFNDNVESESITKILKANSYLNDSIKKPFLFNTSYRIKHDLKLGSHKFNGHWNVFDQWIISSSVLDKTNSTYLDLNNSTLFKRPWLMHKDEQSFGLKPYRSFAGDVYIGGYSDHLPAIIKLDLK